jgi:hypothetical protein
LYLVLYRFKQVDRHKNKIYFHLGCRKTDFYMAHPFQQQKKSFILWRIACWCSVNVKSGARVVCLLCWHRSKAHAVDGLVRGRREVLVAGEARRGWSRPRAIGDWRCHLAASSACQRPGGRNCLFKQHSWQLAGRLSRSTEPSSGRRSIACRGWPAGRTAIQ